MTRSPVIALLTTFLIHRPTTSFTTAPPPPISSRHSLKQPLTLLHAVIPPSPSPSPSSLSSHRRSLLNTLPFLLATAAAPLPSDAAAVRAVGASKAECRENNNCLETLNIDGAVGWNWGGKDRCDATDPLCGPDGKLRSELPFANVPLDDDNGLEVTDVVTVTVIIGKGSDSETGTLRIGLYGKKCPQLVQQFLAFAGGDGITTTSRLLFDEGYGITSAPVRLDRGGAMNLLIPSERLDFGVESQGLAYARSRGLSKLREDFTPQPRPVAIDEATARRHDAAGLISVPKDGLGYGGGVLESEDGAFGSAFQITAGTVDAMDREGRKVVGRLMDEESMKVLGRLAALPTKKGLKGVIPGQNYGPPFLRVLVKDVTIVNVKNA